MDRGAWWATVHAIEKSWTQLNMCMHIYIYTQNTHKFWERNGVVFVEWLYSLWQTVVSVGHDVVCNIKIIAE